METQDQHVDKPSISLFDVIPEFFFVAQSTGYQGVRIRSDVLLINSEIASNLLKTQWENRRPSETKIREWKRRMLAEEWKIAQPLMFDSEGYLLDGQHRLMAVASLPHTNCKIPFLVIQGIPKNNQDVFDIGVNRRMADILTMKGIRIGTTGVSIAKAMFLPFSVSSTSFSKLSSPSYMEKVITLHYEGITEASKSYGANRGNFAPVRAIVALAWKHENHDALRRFLEVWDMRRSRSESEDAISNLRDFYDTSVRKAEGGQAFRRDYAMKACRVLKAHLKGETLKQIRAISQCPWPHPMPDDSMI